MTPLNIQFLHEGARAPTYGTEGAACFDLYAAHDAIVWQGDATLVGTGLAFEVPAGWCMMIYARSGLATNMGIRLANSTGVIDSDYRGEVKVALTCDRSLETGYMVRAGDRIAQAKLERTERIVFNRVERLSATARGAGGFGSTGGT